MGITKKLQEARVALQKMSLSKSGQNKFAGYDYFELADFLPTVTEICEQKGICPVVTFSNDIAKMQLIDVDDDSTIEITSPMGSANLKGCHEVQNIGAVETYQRRYLYMAAFEIVEHDALDAVMNPAGQPPPQTKAPAAKNNPMKAYLESMAKAKSVLNEMSKSDVVYYAALKQHGIEHANEVKNMEDGNKILADLRSFVKSKKEEK